MKTTKNYHALYLKCHVLLLVDVFEKFRNINLKSYGLCLSHCLSAPALSWDATLNIKKVESKLIPDADMYLFVEIGMRDGNSYIFKKYSKTNNKYLKSYDPKQESRHIIYLEANNLYGYVMSKFLPTSEFKWIDPKKFDSNKYSDNISTGSVLEVGFEYPKELCKLKNDYQLFPDKTKIKKETLSKYQLMNSNFYKIPIGNIKILVKKSLLIKKSICFIVKTCNFI